MMVHGNSTVLFFWKIVEQLHGQDARTVFDYILENPESTDEEIARNSDINLSVVRNCLFRLNEESFVMFEKIKQLDGLFIYSWTINASKAEESIERRRLKVIANLKYRIGNEED